jgi:hypothetical protein
LAGWVLLDIARGLARRREFIRIRTPCLKGRRGAAFLLSRLHFLYEKQNSCYLIFYDQIPTPPSGQRRWRDALATILSTQETGEDFFYLNRP